MSEQPKEETKKEKKKKKAKGPIRFGAVIPIIFIFGGLIAGGILFSDTIIKMVIEKGGGAANGAEVNVASVKTSFKDLSVQISGLEWTNPEKPTHNQFEISEINFKMLWDALLRAKIVINELSVKDVMLDSQRKSPGEVYPVEESDSEENKAVNEFLAKTEKEFEGNVLGDISSLLSGNSDKVVGDLTKEMKSKERIAGIQKNITEREQKLKKSFDSLPKDREIKSLESRFKAIRWNDLSNIAKAPKVLNDVKKLKEDGDKYLKQYQSAERELKGFVNFSQSEINKIQGFINDDINNLSKRVKLPRFDTKSVAQSFFGKEMLDKFDELLAYKKKYEKYLPKPKEEKPEEDILAKAKEKRQRGRNYSFGKVNDYPLFWLKKVFVNSMTDHFKGEGTILDVSSDQDMVTRPITLSVEGDMPIKNLNGVRLRGIFDRREDKTLDTLDVLVGNYPVQEKVISESSDASLLMRKADGNVKGKVILDNGKFDIKFINEFRNINYVSKSTKPMIKKVLDGVTRRTPYLNIKADAKGPIENMNWNISSNLADTLSHALQAQFSEMIAEQKKKIEDQVNAQVAAEKAKLMSQYNKTKGQFDSQVSKAKREIAKFQNSLNRKKKSEQKKADKKKNEVKNKAEKEGKKLLKGLGL